MAHHDHHPPHHPADVNECETLQGVCGAELCENVEGSFLCLCPSSDQEFDPMTGRCTRPPGAGRACGAVLEQMWGAVPGLEWGSMGAVSLPCLSLFLLQLCPAARSLPSCGWSPSRSWSRCWCPGRGHGGSATARAVGGCWPGTPHGRSAAAPWAAAGAPSAARGLVPPAAQVRGAWRARPLVCPRRLGPSLAPGRQAAGLSMRLGAQTPGFSQLWEGSLGLSGGAVSLDAWVPPQLREGSQHV